MPTSAEFNESDEPVRKLFDLADAEGVNESERILTSLCRKSFLRLWSQTNVFTDEGFKGGKGSTRELCDALVIFGNEVIVFSDKHIAFQKNQELKVAWPRWYKRAVLDSCRQLHGAKSWLQRFPGRVYLDAKCTRPLPITVPAGETVRFHLVGVTRGSREATLAHNDGRGWGSFQLNTSVEGNQHLGRPFLVGLPEPGKHFVHVFDEVSIELVLNELDTAADFLNYLKEREALLGQRGTQISAFGEEDLLAAYLRTMNLDGTKHVFYRESPENGLLEKMSFPNGIYDALKDDPAYLRKKEADAQSYEWDKLIERFLSYGDPSIHEQYIHQDADEIEQGLRFMAAETRFRRRILADSFIGALRKVGAGDDLGRLAYSGVAGDTVYVFAVVAKRPEESYEDYRQYRIARLHAYVRTARLVASRGTTFVGIAFDNPHKNYPGGSEDLFILEKETWSEDELRDLETKRRELGIWRPSMESRNYYQDEFPQVFQDVALKTGDSADTAASRQRKDAKKRSAKEIKRMKKASQRRNRGR